MKNAQRLAFITVLATVVLIGLGAFVRASGSGLGCPDWPLCHGGVVPPDHHTAWIEFSHRITASIVGLLVIAVAILAWRFYRHSPVIVWTAIATVPLVGFQGILGAITVWRELPPEIVATHLVTAMVILGCQLVVAWGMRIEDPGRRPLSASAAAAERQVALWAVVCLAWLVVAMWVGGYMTESGASTACTGWPTCNGSIIPGNDDQEITHMAHRYLAGGLLLPLAGFAIYAWRSRREARWILPAAVWTAAVFVIQVAVGALNVWYTFPEPLAVAHTAIASLVWAGLASAAFLGLYEPTRLTRGLGLARGVPA